MHGKTSETDQHGEHWHNIARLWQQVGPPLRPSEEDISIVKKLLSDQPGLSSTPRILILGVTPELYQFSIEVNADVLAIDHTQGMIDQVWPGPRDRIMCGEWNDIPLASGSRDIIFCDGGLHLLSNPQGQGELVRSIHRVLTDDGLCIFRLFVPPASQETPEDVLSDLFAGNIPNMNILKLRLGMALQLNSTEGVQLAHVWNTLHKAAPDFASLANSAGWSLDYLNTINTYRDSMSRYYFVTVDEVQQTFTQQRGGFTLESVITPAYQLGERCPTVKFRRIMGS